MKVVAISDMHGYLPEVLPQGDVLCICGDIVPLNIQRSDMLSREWYTGVFGEWIKKFSFKKVLIVPGNHDFFMVNEDSIPALDNVEVLIDRAVEVDGKKIYGTPWITALRNWAFYASHDQLKEYFSNIPDCDILLCHQPPLENEVGKVLDKFAFNRGMNYGSYELQQAIDQKDIKYILCGHVHTGHHVPRTIGGRTYVNVSLKDEHYDVRFDPYVFEI